MTIDLFANVLNNDVIDNLTEEQATAVLEIFEKPDRFAEVPEITETRVRSGKYPPYGQVHRDIDSRWVLNPDDDEKVRVTLSTSHRAESKRFTTTLTWGTVRPAEPGSAFSVETWASDHAYQTVLTTDVARYSEKAMREHHAAAIDRLYVFWDRARVVFEEAAAQIGVPERY